MSSYSKVKHAISCGMPYDAYFWLEFVANLQHSCVYHLSMINSIRTNRAASPLVLSNVRSELERG